jgi:diguanylate cyclase (GGDEF)-like protein
MSDIPVVDRSKRRLRVWRLIAVALAIGGMVGTFFTAKSVATSDAHHSRQQLAALSAEITSTLELAIQHEEDLSVGVGGFVTGRPDASNTQFLDWARTVRAFDRYPELQGFGFTVIVPATGLAAFAARATRDPLGPLGSDGKFQVIPPGNRPFYCLPAVGRMRSPQLAIPAGYDFCAGAGNVPSRDLGQSSYAPLKLGAATLLAVQIPVYRDGVMPTNVGARRAAFLGWVGMVVSPDVVIARALQGKSANAVNFRYHAGSSDVTFHSGTAPSGAAHTLIDLHNGWTVETFGVVHKGGVLENKSALSLLLAGTVITLLLALLVFVLATSRVRALRLVSEKTDELRHQALHDALTGLPNRALIMDRIEQLLARSRRNGTPGAALYVDLDGFKNINDSLGHEAGDRLLQAVAERLSGGLRDADTVGRMGGDEFVILIDGGSLNSAPDLVAERILEVMRQPFDIGATLPIVVTTSVGIAIGSLQEPGELLREADVALYQAKAAGRDCAETFSPEMNAEVQRRYELEFDLRIALDANQFRLMYQPIYTLDDLTLIGVEALLRWDHPTLGEIQPDEFIPLLEASGQIIDVGKWVLNDACTQMAAWRARGSELIVSVNLSGRQLDRDAVVDHVRDALTNSNLEPAALTLEVTETALMRNVDSTARRLHGLKALGVQIAIDDFGTGYSSLAYLQRFPVDSLKIDRSFTEAITRSPESDALIHTLVQLGKDLGLKTLAEGVENTSQIDHLRNEQVNQVQGFLLARPLDPQTLEERLIAPARTSEPGLSSSSGK